MFFNTHTIRNDKMSFGRVKFFYDFKKYDLLYNVFSIFVKIVFLQALVQQNTTITMKKLYYFIVFSFMFTIPFLGNARQQEQENEKLEAFTDNNDSDILNDTIPISTDSLDVQPNEVYEQIVYTPKTSTLHIPITINVSLLEQKLNERFSDLIYEDNNIEDDSLMVKAWKAKEFKIAYDGNVLTYAVPIKLWIKKRFDLGFTYTDQEIEGSVDLKLKTAINFTKDWNLITKTDFIGYEWIEKPVLKLGVVDIPITPIVDKVLKAKKKTLTQKIDETVKKNVPLSQYIQDVWSVVQDPIDVSTEDFKVWLKITPKNLYTTPIAGTAGQIRTTIGIQCLAEIYMDRVPADKQKELSMPAFKMYNSTDEKVKLNVLTDIPYSTIDTLAGNIMTGETFGDGKHQITVDSMNFYGQMDKMIIGVHVHGFINGAIYLSGIPYYDKTTSSIRISEVDYKLKTKNVLAKVVNLFYKKGLKKMIEENVVISIKDKLEWVKEMSRSELFNRELFDNVYLSGFLNDLDVDAIHLTKEGLKVSVNLGGKFILKVE